MNDQRTDPHRPGLLDPADYRYIGSLDAHEGEDYHGYIDPDLESAFENMPQHDGHFAARLGCDHCGQHNVLYFDGFEHLPTGELVIVGWQCADTLGAQSREQAAARKKIRALQAVRKSRRKLAEWLAEDPRNAEAYEFLRAQLISTPVEKPPDGMPFWIDEPDGSRKLYLIEDEFYASVLRAALKYGYLTERQRGAVLRSRDRRAEYAAEREAERATEPDPTPVITGKVEVTGKVLSVKTKENAYGSRLVMTVLDDRGFRVWGTVPADLEFIDVYRDREGEDGKLDHQRVLERGDRVQFTATVTASDDDETFGFYKRPRKATLLTEEKDTVNA